MDRRTALLNAALDKVTGKADDYDKPEDSFREIAEAWSWWKGVEFTVKDVSMMMALLKMSRLKHSPDHYDSVLDLAGYAACYADLLPEDEKAEPRNMITPEARAKYTAEDNIIRTKYPERVTPECRTKAAEWYLHAESL